MNNLYVNPQGSFQNPSMNQIISNPNTANPSTQGVSLQNPNDTNTSANRGMDFGMRGRGGRFSMNQGKRPRMEKQFRNKFFNHNQHDFNMSNTNTTNPLHNAASSSSPDDSSNAPRMNMRQMLRPHNMQPRFNTYGNPDFSRMGFNKGPRDWRPRRDFKNFNNFKRNDINQIEGPANYMHRPTMPQQNQLDVKGRFFGYGQSAHGQGQRDIQIMPNQNFAMNLNTNMMQPTLPHNFQRGPPPRFQFNPQQMPFQQEQIHHPPPQQQHNRDQQN